MIPEGLKLYYEGTLKIGIETLNMKISTEVSAQLNQEILLKKEKSGVSNISNQFLI